MPIPSLLDRRALSTVGSGLQTGVAAEVYAGACGASTNWSQADPALPRLCCPAWPLNARRRTVREPDIPLWATCAQVGAGQRNGQKKAGAARRLAAPA